MVDELAALSVPFDEIDILSSESSREYSLPSLTLPSGSQVEAFLVDPGLVLQLPSQQRNAPEGCLVLAMGWALEAALRAASFLED